METIVARGETISKGQIAPLLDSSPIVSDPEKLKKRFDENGYIFLRQFYLQEDIDAVREEVFSRLADVGEILNPFHEGIFSGSSQRKSKHKDLGEFWRSVSESWTLRRLSHGVELHRIMDILLGEMSRVQDYVFLRPAGPGKHTNVHCDAPFFTRTTDKVATAWLALGDIPTRLGPLFIVENSHNSRALVDQFRGIDYDVEKTPQASLQDTPSEIATRYSTRLLTTDYTAGDVLIFNMYLFHGALDNATTSNEVRLSCDVRYQAKAATLDPRYFGPNPTGTTGAGYGELVGAKPMTEDWHQR